MGAIGCIGCGGGAWAQDAINRSAIDTADAISAVACGCCAHACGFGCGN